jgi:uncharacterized Ntn-hydrolase superfamily protein
MTFSLAARDPRTGAFGIVISSSSPAVASRCLHLRAGVGAVTSQNVTNPALGPRLLDRIASGQDAESAIAEVAAEEPHAAHRQLTAVDTAGRVAVFSGSLALGTFGSAEGGQAVAAGNLLAGADVPQAMLDAYLSSTAGTFEERLLDGFRGALSAGGEAGPVRSAGLAVVESVRWNVTDLRVDDHDDPAGELARLLTLWLPQKDAYVVRALHPDEAPSYGVPGDL